MAKCTSTQKTITQCKSCPWKVGVDPAAQIPGYREDLARNLVGTLASGIESAAPALYGGTMRVMACHYSKVGDEHACAGWLHHQLGRGNNLGVRLRVLRGDMPVPIVDGEQHERYEDTLPWMRVMRERPILFSTPMVKALLAGTKTVTRRIVKPQPELNEHASAREHEWYRYHWPSRVAQTMVCVRDMSSLGPFGYVGDRLWVKETFTHITGNGIRVHYRADGEPVGHDGKVLPTDPGCRRWMPSIFMPRKHSRITLEITGVRVERLHDITEEDAMREGVLDGGKGRVYTPVIFPARMAFERLWNEINGKPRPLLDDDGDPVLDGDGDPVMVTPTHWNENPWVWRVEFKRVKP